MKIPELNLKSYLLKIGCNYLILLFLMKASKQSKYIRDVCLIGLSCRKNTKKKYKKFIHQRNLRILYFWSLPLLQQQKTSFPIHVKHHVTRFLMWLTMPTFGSSFLDIWRGYYVFGHPTYCQSVSFMSSTICGSQMSFATSETARRGGDFDDRHPITEVDRLFLHSRHRENSVIPVDPFRQYAIIDFYLNGRSWFVTCCLRGACLW